MGMVRQADGSYTYVDDAQAPSPWDIQSLSGGAVSGYGAQPSYGTPSYAGSMGGGGGGNPLDVSGLMNLTGKNPNGSGFGWNMPTVAAGIQGIGQLGQLYLGLQQLGLAKDSFKFQKQAYNTNLANQTSAYNTQIRDRVAGRNYATEEERKAAEAAALLPVR